MTVVSNTSPIINLAAIGWLHLLQAVYLRLVIPQAVYHEIAIVGLALPGAGEVAAGEWIESRSIVVPSNLSYLQAILDQGEAEAILLALELQADLLLMDEKRGRRVAQSLGIPTVGLLGVLIEAKQQGKVERVRPILEDLIDIANFRIAPDLYSRVLEAAGES